MMAFVARHFDRLHTWLAVAMVHYAERQLADHNRDMIAARKMAQL